MAVRFLIRSGRRRLCSVLFDRHTGGLILAAALMAPSAALAQPPAPPEPSQVPGFDLLLPLADGEQVWASGPHSAMNNSVDFGKTISVPVHAANAGLLQYFSLDGFANCGAVITHPSGWKTTYLHLVDADPSLDQTTVLAGQQIAHTGQPSTNITNGQPVPGGNTCALGTPNFPHLHFGIESPAGPISIDGLSMGGYTVHSTGASYCGSWTRDTDGQIAAGPACVAVGTLINDQAVASQVVAGPVASFDPQPFVDVGPDSFAYEGVAILANAGITTGTSATTFGPSDFVTREQMAAFLGRTISALGAPCPQVTTPFVDIAPTSYARRDIACLYGSLITTGTSATTFAPEEFVTREQMAAFLGRLWRKLGRTCPRPTSPFVDVEAASYAYADVACLYGLGITSGTSTSTFDPRAFVTRAQMAGFLGRLWNAATNTYRS